MTDHEEYRHSLLADPGRPTPSMLAHLADCQACKTYTDRLLRFEDRLERALRVEVPGTADAPARARGGAARSRVRHRLRHGLAVAASVLVAVVLGGGLWLGSAGKSLAAAVVDHMAEEPDAWVRTTVSVPPSRLQQVMAESSLHLKSGAGLVSYANSCGFRGHRVPHLVVQTDAGPVTVMVLTQESVHGPVRFDEQGYRGVIVPVPGHGSLAVLERAGRSDSATTLQQVAADVLAAIEWNSQSVDHFDSRSGVKRATST